MKKFELELSALKAQLVAMGTLAESMAANASAALLAPDAAAIAQVRHDEPALDRFQIEIDRDAIRLITVYSPVARDLRCLLMIARINSELERIGDEAIDNCRWVETFDRGVLTPPLDGLRELSSLTLQMVRGAMQAFEHENIDQARSIIDMDDRIDRLEAAMLHELAERPPRQADVVAAVGLVLVARALERMADHATNICEEVYYWLEGEDIRHR